MYRFLIFIFFRLKVSRKLFFENFGWEIAWFVIKVFRMPFFVFLEIWQKFLLLLIFQGFGKNINNQFKSVCLHVFDFLNKFFISSSFKPLQKTVVIVSQSQFFIFWGSRLHQFIILKDHFAAFLMILINICFRLSFDYFFIFVKIFIFIYFWIKFLIKFGDLIFWLMFCFQWFWVSLISFFVNFNVIFIIFH